MCVVLLLLFCFGVLGCFFFFLGGGCCCCLLHFLLLLFFFLSLFFCYFSSSSSSSSSLFSSFYESGHRRSPSKRPTKGVASHQHHDAPQTAACPARRHRAVRAQDHGNAGDGHAGTLPAGDSALPLQPQRRRRHERGHHHPVDRRHVRGHCSGPQHPSERVSDKGQTTTLPTLYVSDKGQTTTLLTLYVSDKGRPPHFSHST